MKREDDICPDCGRQGMDCPEHKAHKGAATSAAEEHVRAAIKLLERAHARLMQEHRADGYGSKARPLRFIENALLALSQAYPK